MTEKWLSVVVLASDEAGNHAVTQVNSPRTLS